MAFISKDQDTTSNFAPFPAGTYQLRIDKVTPTKTKAGNGSYLAIEMTVARGKQKGRKIWHNLNLDNPSTEAVEIAKKEAMMMVEQIKKAKIDIESEKHLIKILSGSVVKAQVKIRKSDEWGDKNEIAYFIQPEKGDADTSSSDDDSSSGSSSTPPWEQEEKKSKKDKKKKKKKGKKSKEE